MRTQQSHQLLEVAPRNSTQDRWHITTHEKTEKIWASAENKQQTKKNEGLEMMEKRLRKYLVWKITT